MATVFKRGGKGNRGGSYYIAYRSYDGKRKTKCARTTDKATAERIAAKLDSEAALRREGVVDADLETYAKEPWRASINRSLVRSYRLAGDLDKASKHLEEGLEIGLKRIEDKPGSASAAYSLGRTLLLADRRQEALEQFTKAYEKDPTSSRYRKAYYSAR